MTRESIMMFVAEELPTFSVKTFNLENLLNCINIRPWPVKNYSVAHEGLWSIKRCYVCCN